MNENRAFRGVWIPADVWLNRDLTLNEKVMLIEIDSLQHPERGCFKSNAALAQFFGLSPSRVSEIITSLAKKGLVRIQQIRHGKSVVERRVYMVRPINDGSGEGIRDSEEGYSENRIGVFDIPKVSNTRERDTRERDRDCADAPRTPKRATKLPDDLEPNETNQRVAQQHGVKISDELPQFCDYHRAKGSKMEDWHAALNTWLRNASKFSQRSANHEASRSNRRESPLAEGIRLHNEVCDIIDSGNFNEWWNGGTH